MNRSISLLLAIFTLALFFPSCKEKEQEKGSIYGVMVDAQSAEPMRGTQVQLYTGSELLLSTVTYDDGHYEFRDLAPGSSYAVGVKKDGYKNFAAAVTVEPGRQARCDIALLSAAGPAPKSSIYGVVVDASTGEPLRAAMVCLYSEGALLLSTRTSDDGSYEFKPVHPKIYTVKIAANGYKDYTAKVIVQQEQRVHFDIVLTPQTPQTSIYGKVTDAAEGYPLEATVKLFSSGVLIADTYANRGNYAFSKLEKGGSYDVVVQKYDYKDSKASVNVELGKRVRCDVALARLNTMTVHEAESAVTGSSVVLGSYFELHGSPAPSEYGFYYANHPSPLTDGLVVKGSLGYNNLFTASLSALQKGTYYVRAYAKNSRGVVYGDEVSFEVTGLPVVSTKKPTHITTTTARLNAEIVYAGEPPFTERGFVYSQLQAEPSLDDDPSATTTVVVAGTSGAFSVEVSGLTDETSYYVRAYAKHAGGVTYGTTQKFRTEMALEKYVVILRSDNLMVMNQDITAGQDYYHADELCDKVVFAGFSDWRLPSIGELETLYKKRADIVGFSDDIYWSSTFNLLDDDCEVLNFSDGTKSTVPSSEYHRARAVRSLR